MINLSFFAHRLARVATLARWTCAATCGAGSLLAADPAPRLASFSCFAHLQATETFSATGFVIAGKAEKNLLLRCVGPGLRQIGMNDGVPDPVLRVMDSAGREIRRGQGWLSEPNADEIRRITREVGAFSLPAGGADTALLVRLAPGAYTLNVTSAEQNAGAVLTEIYETDAVGSLANMATISCVSATHPVFYGTFRVTGTTPKKLLVRAAGPALTGVGIDRALSDPKLMIYTYAGAGSVGQNDDWCESSENPANAEAIVATTLACGAFPLSAESKDAAMVVQLAPGAYTAQVTGKSGESGLVLLEIYEVP